MALLSRHALRLPVLPLLRLGTLAALALSVATPAHAGVERVEIASRGSAFGGRTFGSVGAYELIEGTLHLAYDPELAANARVVDLDLAPRDEDGRVRARADFRVLRPENPDQGSSTALFEVPNRGRAGALGVFNRATSRDLADPAGAGDGFLMERGLTIVWIGWQFDVPERDGLLRLEVPRVTRPEGVAPISGLVRADWVLDEPAERLELGHRGHVPYPVQAPGHPLNVLTWRAGRRSPSRKVQGTEWSFAEDGTAIVGAFEAGRIYELVYRAQDPALVGLGLAAVRDAVALAKFGEDCPFGAERAVAFGVSQTGRFLRHFLYEGFNVDEANLRAFDGMLIHAAGAGRGSFNHRFAQPSRDAHRYSSFFYPTDLFPFTGRVQRDPVAGRSDGLLAALEPRHRPRTMLTNTGYEYWGRAGSLVHTSLFATADVEPLAEERIYHLASGQHFVSPLPAADAPMLYPPERSTARAWRGNPLDFGWTERALLDALVRWVEDDAPPPASAYPRIDEGTLVAPGELAFPALRGVAVPERAHEAHRLDFGVRWESDRAIDVQPPEVGPAFATLVPQVDRCGNETGGVPSVETLAPLATYTPWSVREELAGGNGELADFFGNVLPLPKNAGEQRATGDTRPTLEELYGPPETAKERWLEQARGAARSLVERGFLLEQDVEAVLAQAERTWDWIAAMPVLEVQFR